MPSDLAEVRVWRLGRATRILAGLLIGGMAVAVVVFFLWQATTPDGDLLAPLAIAAPYGLIGFAMWRRIFHPRLSAGPEGLILRGPWRTIRVPWSAVVRCDAGYHGITITCADGSRVVAPAPQRSNLSRWLGRETRADVVAAYLERRAREHRRVSAATGPAAPRPNGDAPGDGGYGSERTSRDGDGPLTRVDRTDGAGR
ncbi:PH domain-containing protein [Micromonospora sp. S4605]|uniref:PH domain-containing protein n=1 Tax=Micromonospora sp. S4605 TaxID=1420897 RepID=UPI0013052AC7|nr:PH domain-containing protein [Micromonospora sp. S4605]